ncbi:MAG: hypothetical protein BM563_05620 [Bacteroidetes bacterium MedPE-SWsnd-G1]|nr:MAG: hypothetical protein BM563_05620 [Bacteroidetes bacterium MedPE-SWsnd-G1]
MKYTIEIELNLPRKRVIELFDNPENMKHWQEGFISFTPLDGVPGEVGSTAELKYKTGKRAFELVETIIVNNFPDEFSASYKTTGMTNYIYNYFIEVDKNTTKWISENKCNARGIVKLMTLIMPGTFKKYSMKFLKDFKNFAESKN